jgi:tetratricopeptide (TPR) repeat protein
MSSPTVSDVPSSKPEPTKKTAADLYPGDLKIQAGGRVSSNGAGINTVSPKKKYFVVFFFVSLLACACLWAILPSSNKQIESQPVTTLNSESKETAGKVSPVVIEAPSPSPSTKPTPDIIVKIPPVSVQNLEEKKVAPQNKPPLSFVEIDRAIDGEQLAKAQTLLNDVIRNSPESAGAYFRLAQVFAKEDKYPEAREQLNKAKRIDPSLNFTAPGKFQELYNEILAMEKMSKLPGRD